MSIFLRTAILFVLKWICSNELSSDQINRVKNLIADLETRAIDTVIKHQSAADLIKSFATNLSNTAVDALVKLLLLQVRANA